jgi:hypothetical protein
MLPTKLKLAAAVLFAASGAGVAAVLFSFPGLAGEEPTGEKQTRSDACRLSKDAAERYAALLPRAEELKYRDIPWLVDLSEAIAVAKEEKRPVLIWVSGDEPLELC